jgi:hypothetical protein
MSPIFRIAVGCGIAVGPIATFFFVSKFPGFFSEKTILAWHYISAFGISFYGPIGLILVIIGIIELIKSPNKLDEVD